MRDNAELELMLKGYGLTTAQILYHMPDHPHVLQTFIWQHGPLHSVAYTHRRLVAPNEWRNVAGELALH